MARSVLVLVLVSMGCAAPMADESIEDLNEYVAPETPDTFELDVGVLQTRGQLELDGQTYEFGLEQIGENSFDVFLQLHGLRLTLLLDRSLGVMEFDGYTADDASNTLVTPEDREAIETLVHAFDSLGEEVEVHVDVLRQVIGHWAEYNEAMPLLRQHLYEESRAVQGLCGSCRSYVKFSFDCNHGGWWTDRTTAYGYVRHFSAYSCASGTKWKKTGSGGSYCRSSDPDHFSTFEYGYGNCFARCGGGCGSSRRYTKDCGHHDLCVRSNHAISSAYCNDQLASASDDAVSSVNCTSC